MLWRIQKAKTSINGKIANGSKPMKSEKTVLWVTLALLGSSVEPIIVKLGQNNQIPSFQLLVLKLLCGGILFVPLYRKFRIHSMPMFRRLLFVSLLAMGTNYCVFLSIENLSVPFVITLLATTPIFVGLLNHIQGRVILRREFWLGFIAVFIGILISVDYTQSSFSSFSAIGFFYALMSIFGSTTYRTSVQKLCEEIDPLQISIFIFMINGVFALMLLPWIGDVKNDTWPIVIWLGLAGAIANIAFINAIHVLGATMTSLITLLQRPLVILIAAFVLNTTLSVLQVAGIVLVIVGVKFAKVDKIGNTIQVLNR